jgi:phospholipid transport system transporter-binding protein
VTVVQETRTAHVALADNGTLAVSGALTFSTVPDVWQQSAEWLRRSDGPSTIDLNDLRRTDSAGLALLVEWLRLATAAGRSLRFVNIPEQVRSLIRVNGLGKALNVPDLA